MLDNTQMVYNHNEVNFNSVAGTIVKSHKDSIITRFHMNSEMAKTFLSEFSPRDTRDRPIIVLQVMLCGDSQFLIEYIRVTDE